MRVLDRYLFAGYNQGIPKKGRIFTVKKLYISPVLEILYFIPMENVANSIDWYNGDLAETDDMSADATIPGGQIPGWGS